MVCVFSRLNPYLGNKLKGGELFDLSESPLAYKNIDEVIEAELDLFKPLVKLRPQGVVKR
ncbi:MAG: hypothetical protein HND39_12260 [Ignavibacteriota bacterium]|nr:RtcB family protein [Ignavibacteriales bacterium]MBL1121253.1 hypothetical protein [Ignavibacteriota bacterium]MCE7856498.1 hypothetical protein [Ignavibacteria bacterium CHB3]MCZ7613620.1 RtcB family protein [Ignavibacteriaceae bacterium]MEB2297877.1 RtcB family protein [Ignavibacteria bacterium]